MKLKNNKIPTRFGKKMGYGICDDHYIDYNKKVFLIEENSKGTHYQIQCDGTSCLQIKGVGILKGSFKTTSKYFNSTYWYRLTRWLLDEGLMLFNKKTEKVSLQKLIHEFDDVKKQFRPLAIKEEKVLNSIISHASKKLGIDLKFAYPEKTSYGIYWKEAYVPVIYKSSPTDKGIKYFLTWSNCD